MEMNDNFWITDEVLALLMGIYRYIYSMIYGSSQVSTSGNEWVVSSICGELFVNGSIYSLLHTFLEESFVSH